MYIVAVIAAEFFEPAASLLETLVIGDFFCVTACAFVPLFSLVSQWIFFRMHHVARDAGDTGRVMQAARPLHSLGASHILRMAIEAGRCLLGAGCPVAEAQQRRHAGDATRTRDMQTARSVAGFAALQGKGRIRIIRIAVRGRGDKRHPVGTVAAQTAFAAILGVLGLGSFGQAHLRICR